VSSKENVGGREYCSELAIGEPMAGTASIVHVWIVLEYVPAWGARAVTDNDLTSEMKTWLAGVPDALPLGLNCRVLFARQPEIDRSLVRLLVGITRDDHPQLFAFEAERYEDLKSINIAEVVAKPQKFAGHLIDEPQYFVCTNGQRDLCCARFGRLTYTALRELAGDRVWQVTHLGGHRFAPNVLVLPQGVLYGRVDADDVPAFFDQADDNKLAVDWARGRSCYPPEVQAAEIFLGGGVESGVSIETGEDSWWVRFLHGPSVNVRLGDAAEVMASCGDEKVNLIRPYQPG
jgi:hypothetical protein